MKEKIIKKLEEAKKELNERKSHLERLLNATEICKSEYSNSSGKVKVLEELLKEENESKEIK